MTIVQSINDSKIKLTEKLFYGRFPYRLAFKFPMITTNYTNSRYNFYSHSTSRIDKDDFSFQKTATKLEYILKTFPYDSYKTRMEKEMVIFLATLDQVELILAHVGTDNVSQITKPINKRHCDLLKDNTTLVFKRDKYWKNYNIKVNFKCSDNFLSKSVPWLQNFLHESDNKKAYRTNAPLSRLFWKRAHQPTYNFKRQDLFLGHSLYVENEDDLMMIKLAIGEDISSVYRVILFEELGKPQENY